MRGAKYSKWLVVIVVAVIGSTATVAQTPLGTEITYQGQLGDNGAPANGDYDFVFRLFDAETGGAQIGSDFPVDDWTVGNGLFTVQVDFGAAAFGSEARWLEVAVRPGASAYPHTVLTPRQPVTAAPVALYALGGPGATGFWEADGNNIVNTNTGFVGVGRSTPIVPSTEFFGVLTPTGNNAYGGMHIQTEGESGWPYYGYSTTSGIKAWTYFDTGADKWHLYAGGPRLTVDRSTGYVGIGTSSPSTALEVNGTATATAFVGDGSGLTGISGDTLWETSGGDIYYNAGNVGIGTSAPDPDYDLTVGGDIKAVSSQGGIDAYTSTNLVLPSYAAVYGSAYNMDSYGYLGGVYGVYGQTDSASSNAAGVRGNVSMTSPGMYSAGVLGHNNGTGNFGYGVHGTQDGSGIGVYGSTPSGYGVYGTSSNGIGVSGSTYSVSSNAMGVEGFVNSTTPGSYSAGVRGRNNGTGGLGIGVWGSQDGSGWGVYGYTPSGAGVYGSSTDGIGVRGHSDNGYAGYFTGTVRVSVLEVAGADVAEKFPVSEQVKPGMVVAIDAENPGKLCLSHGAYNRRVAGVVSGAGNIPTGTILGNLPGSEDAPPIALSGRVWVKCDATETPIELGDLLTTSNTPGHAMAVGDFSRAHGTVIGKAMTPLARGETGLVLVLVNLQ